MLGAQSILAKIGVILLFLIVVPLTIFILRKVAYYKVYSKSGEHGWKVFIPFYSHYIRYKLMWQPRYFWFYLIPTIVISVLGIILIMNGLRIAFFVFFWPFIFLYAIASPDVLNIYDGFLDNINAMSILFLVTLIFLLGRKVLSIILKVKMAKNFGYGKGFTIGLIFLNLIFIMILAFGHSEYKGPTKLNNH